MSTPNSNASSYLDATTYLTRVDWRTVGDLCSDTGSRLPQQQLLGPPVNANLQAALDDASGEVEAACTVGARYDPTDLAGLTGVSQKYLFRLIATLATAYLVQRRPELNKPLPPAYEAAQKALEYLAAGGRIFGLREVQQAGNPLTYKETVGDVWARDLIVTQGRRFFGRRVDQHCGWGW